MALPDKRASTEVVGNRPDREYEWAATGRDDISSVEQRVRQHIWHWLDREQSRSLFLPSAEDF